MQNEVKTSIDFCSVGDVEFSWKWSGFWGKGSFPREEEIKGSLWEGNGIAREKSLGNKGIPM